MLRTWGIGILVVLAALCGPMAVLAETVDDPMLADVKVGDWIEQRVVMPPETPMTMTMKQTVVAVTPDEVTIEQVNSSTMSGKPMPPQTTTMKRPRKVQKTGAPEVKPPEFKETTETIKGADGKEYKCTVYQTTTAGQVTKSFICKDIPLGGIVRSEANGKPALELIGWGRGK